jgi:hypothetical protein
MNDEIKSTKKKVVNFDQLYAGRFLKAGELLGKKPTLTIDEVYLEKLKGEDGSEKNKAILSFKETEKALVACKTNGLCIKAMFGKLINDWEGKRITLFEDSWNGEPCDRASGGRPTSRRILRLRCRSRAADRSRRRCTRLSRPRRLRDGPLIHRPLHAPRRQTARRCTATLEGARCTLHPGQAWASHDL